MAKITIPDRAVTVELVDFINSLLNEMASADIRPEINEFTEPNMIQDLKTRAIESYGFKIEYDSDEAIY